MHSTARIGWIAALLVGIGWLALRYGGASEALGGGVVRPDERYEPAAELEAGQRAADHREPARQAAGQIDATIVEDSLVSQGQVETFTLRGRLVLPDRRGIRVPEVTARIYGPDVFLRTYKGWDVDSIQFEDVHYGAHALEVQVEGYRHRTELLDLAITPLDGGSSVHYVTLWPDRWIPIVIRTRDGLPFRALADDLELEPMQLFVDAFRVAAAHESFSTAAPLPSIANELARFHPPPGYQNVELPGAVACSLELRAAPPMWVGLWVHGIFHEDRPLLAADTELVFEIDMDLIDASLARVSAQLVERDSGAAVVDARATLKADTSAHRRGDLSDVVSDDTGRLVFERAIPGQHELTILRQGHIVQRRITLSPGEDLDLGDIPLGSGPGLPIRVVDAEGRPVQAWIEIASLEPGSYVGELYPPNLHRLTDQNGHFVLPVPDRVSVVRARPSKFPIRESPEPGTRNMLIDPDQLPAELVLVAGDQVALRVEPLTTWIDGHSVTFEDEHGLVIDYAGGENDGRLSANLVPGPYVVRRWEGKREVGSLDVVVTQDIRRVRCP